MVTLNRELGTVTYDYFTMLSPINKQIYGVQALCSIPPPKSSYVLGGRVLLWQQSNMYI